MQEDGADERGPGRREAPRAGLARRRRGGAARAPAAAARGRSVERRVQRGDGARAQLGVLVEQQRVAARGRAAAARCRSRPCPRRWRERDDLGRRRGGARAAPAEPSFEALSRTSTSVANGSASRSAAIASRQRTSSSRCSVFTTQKETSTATGRLLSPAVRVDVVDPSAYTPPYDHALCAALARAGARATLVTSAFVHGDVPRAGGLRGRRALLPRRPGGGPRPAPAAKLARHVPDMLAAARAARAARRGRRALPVAGRAAARRGPAARVPAPARPHGPRRPAARAAARASARRSGRSTGASTRSSCTPSTAARAPDRGARGRRRAR